MRKFLAFMVLLVFAVLAPAAIYAVNLQSTLLAADFYKDMLERSNAYDRLGPVLAEIVVSDLEERLAEEFGEEAPPLPKEELEEIIAELIEPRWLKGQVEGVVDDFFAWLDSSEALPNISLNLRPIKEQLPEAMPKIITAFFAAQWEELPLCAAGEIPSFTDFGPSCRPLGVTLEEFLVPPWEKIPVCTGNEPPIIPGLPPACLAPGVAEGIITFIWPFIPVCPEGEGIHPGQIPICRPQGMTAEEAIAFLKNPLLANPLVREIIDEFPTELTLHELIVGEARGDEARLRLEQAVQDFRDFRDSIRAFQERSWLLPGLSGLAFLTLAVLAATSLRSLLGWTGSGLFIGGLIALIPTLFLSSAGFIVEGALADFALTPQAAEFVLSFAQEALRAVFSPIQQQAAIMAGVGIVGILAAVVAGVVRGRAV